MACDKTIVVKGLCSKCVAQPQDKGNAGQQFASPCNTGSPKLLALADYALNALLRADYKACEDFINNIRKQLRAGA
jgi:hypothetical protein